VTSVCSDIIRQLAHSHRSRIIFKTVKSRANRRARNSYKILVGKSL
jgi:hypothetical protein